MPEPFLLLAKLKMSTIKKGLVILLCALGVFSTACHHLGGNKVCAKGRCFFVELARTDEERRQGLMFRENLGNNQGMLFIFDEERHYPFWMKNTLIPLDIIWIDKNQKVVFMRENARPCTTTECETIYPPHKALYVLEVNAGVVNEINLGLGDVLQFSVE
jgi:uncharacterized membrane protein (UPF0127 family)